MKTHEKWTKPITLVLFAVFGLIIALSGYVLAQQQSTWEQQNQDSKQMSNRQNRSVSQSQSQSLQQKQNSRPSAAAQWQLDPKARVNVGYDYNNDGIFDAFEQFTVYDLEKMRSDRQGRQTQEQAGKKYQTSTAQKKQQDVVRGKIMRTHTVNIANTGKPHLVAKVQTPQGIANIDLGPEANLSALNLQKGNQIKVYGVQGKINDNFLLLADRVQVEGQRVKINRNDARPLHTFNATVLSTRTLSRNQQKILLARLQLQNGTKTIVNLGPQKQLPIISHGQQIQVLARLTEIQGKKALIADRLRTQGQTYRIDWNQQQKEAS